MWSRFFVMSLKRNFLNIYYEMALLLIVEYEYNHVFYSIDFALRFCIFNNYVIGQNLGLVC